VEHHFLPGYSHVSCPEQFLVAVAMLTKRIRLGHGIMHMPFKINHPFRVAEHIGTLDVLSGGRVEFGAGQAIIGSPQTCARFINNLIDVGVDEVMLFMQGATTPHDKILESIRLFAEEVRPQLKRP
jgi:alkanesulfonate monooxygenase SsuD/methylene tetrahydromethanopterin reductase-like flavin-dependent oxidoreductase (luciferase family)